MSVFVHEFFCSGAFFGDLGNSSLAREGLAMLAAAIDDFSRCGPDRVLTTLDRRLRGCAAVARIGERTDVTWIESPADERRLFQEFAAQAEATLVIAPETGGCLLERRRLTDAAGGRFLGPSADAIDLCGDKLRLCEHLTRHSLPTLTTTAYDFSDSCSDYPFPIVVKPRDGAGSINTYVIRDPEDLHRRRDELVARFADAGHEPIVQPFVEGRSLSTAALIGPDPNRIEIFPLGEQRLSHDGRIHYCGGRIPAVDLSPQLARDAVELVRGACRSLLGLSGFVGFDLIATPVSPQVRLVEINPRLTTSYVGYRRVTSDNLAARLLGVETEPIEWHVSPSPVGWDKSRRGGTPVHHPQASASRQFANTGGLAAGGPALSHPTQTAPPTCVEHVEFDADGERPRR
jgi:predicted ATP-grasp superfamily ATP-dependent carboligase